MRKILLLLLFWLFLSAPAAGETWSFAVVGDTQGLSSSEPVSPVFDKIIAEVNLIRPDFVVHLGDMISGSAGSDVLKSQFLIYRQKIAGLLCPIYEVAGNHDVPLPKSFSVYRETISPFLYYSFDHKGCHFVILCSEMETGLSGALGKEQLAWLEEDLKSRSGAFPVFVFIHRPLYRGVLHPYILKDAGELERVLRRQKVRYLFAGHEHRFGIAHRGILTEYISGGGGAPLLNFSEEAGGFYHFLVVSVKEDGVSVDPVKIDHPKVYQDFGNLWKTYNKLRKISEQEEKGKS